MRALFIGNDEDRTGFALAGIEAHVCLDRGALEAELARLVDELPRVGLLLLSADVAALAPAALRAFRERPGAPPVLAVPAPAARAGGAR